MNVIAGKTVIKAKHHDVFKRNIVRVLKERGLLGEVDIENLFNGKRRSFKTTDEKDLEMRIKEAIKDKTIYTKEKRLEIEKLGHKLGVYSYKYRFLLANILKQKNQPEKALEQLVLILTNFRKGNLHNAILLNIAQLKKPEEISLFLTTYKDEIEDTNKKVKELILTICAKKLNMVKDYTLALKIAKTLKNSKNLNIKQKAFKNLAYSSKGKKEYSVALEYYKGSISDVSNFYEHEKLQLFALECYRELKDREQIKVTLEGIKKTRILNDKKIYGGEYKIGMTYLFLNEKEKAIKSFEKEVFENVNLFDINFKKNAFLESVVKLVHLYDKDEKKQLELMQYLTKTPEAFIPFEHLLYLSRFYIKLGLNECSNHLILNSNFEINI